MGTLGRQVKEEQLQAAWAALAGAPAEFTTQEGERLRVRFPGVPNRGAGPDFRGAILETERGRIVRGDVEVHRTPAGWAAHGHTTDERYDGVVLHVVGEAPRVAPTGLPGGGRVPVLPLALGPAGLPAGRPGHPCAVCRPLVGRDAAPGRLEVLGLTRLRAKAAVWRRALLRSDADQLLYAACLETLGYPGNRRVLRRVAGVIPWQRLAGVPDHLECQALLLGATGWLPGPNGLPAALTAELWRRWQAAGAPVAADRAGWQLGACRPAAHPARRLAGAGAWSRAWTDQGPAGWLHGLASGPPAGLAKRVVAGFTVSAAAAGLEGPAVIGAARAGVVLVNVALPFLLAQAALTGDNQLADAATEAYRKQPGLEADGVVRPLAEALGLSGVRFTACQQQGLHHLFRRCCLRGRQGRCALVVG